MLDIAVELLEAARAKGLKIATAESCTGGMVASALVDVVGSSDVFDRGFVTYSNESKTEMLGVDAALIMQFGAVSKQVAIAMAEGALARSAVDMAVAITGVAGPEGGTDKKPVGLVFFAVAFDGKILCERAVFEGDRVQIRQQAMVKAIEMMLHCTK